MKNIVLLIALCLFTYNVNGATLLCEGNKQSVDSRISFTFDEDFAEWELIKNNKIRGMQVEFKSSPNLLTFYAKGFFENKLVVNRKTLAYNYHKSLDLSVSDKIVDNGQCEIVKEVKENLI
jgi:hypothetical protein